MEKKIITIGYEIPGHSDWYFPFSSNQSILDADIIVFEPNFSKYSRIGGNSQGKPNYAENVFLKLQEDSQYWQKELSTALEAGKTIFVFFKKFEEAYFQKGLMKPKLYDNYQFFPVSIPTIVPRRGKEIVFSGHPIFSSLWDIFEGKFKYESYLDYKVKTPLFTTRTGDKVVGALFRVGSGNIVLLPVLGYDRDKFRPFDRRARKYDWSTEATNFGSSLVKAFVDIDKALRNDDTRTPPPGWTNDENFQLARERTMREETDRKSEEIDKLTSEKSELLKKIDREGKLRDLLFEKGKALESVVISALEILGYKADNYDDGILELDQVIISPDGDRFIGETEGKDKSAVGVDKLRQLITNTLEDLDRDEVEKQAVGILFGNGCRLTKPSDRTELFTPKCIEATNSSNCTLVRTTDLFQVVKYIRESGDDDFAKSCRDAIKNGVGQIVEFPPIPNKSLG